MKRPSWVKTFGPPIPRFIASALSNYLSDKYPGWRPTALQLPPGTCGPAQIVLERNGDRLTINAKVTITVIDQPDPWTTRMKIAFE